MSSSESGTLYIKIIGANSVPTPSDSPTNSFYPFVEASLVTPNTGETTTSRTVRAVPASLKKPPIWNAVLRLKYLSSKQKLVFKLYDKRRGSQDLLLGECELDILSIPSHSKSPAPGANEATQAVDSKLCITTPGTSNSKTMLDIQLLRYHSPPLVSSTSEPNLVSSAAVSAGQILTNSSRSSSRLSKSILEGPNDWAYSGWLEKKSPSAPYFWEKRFFVLRHDGILVYYKKDPMQGGKMAGSVALEYVKVQLFPHSSKVYTTGFQLVTPNRTYNLRSLSTILRDQWISHLNSIINRSSSRSANPFAALNDRKNKNSLDMSSSDDYTFADGNVVWSPNAFKFICELGSGAFGSVYKAKWVTMNKIFAIKTQKVKNSNTADSIANEYDVLKTCRHPNITPVFGTCNYQDSVWIIQEFCSLGSIEDLLKIYPNGLKEDQCAYILKSALDGLAYLHSKKIIHRDLKSGNLLVHENGQIKIADFGVSKAFEGFDTKIDNNKGRALTLVGTPHFLAPEVWQGSGYSNKVDIWSFGVLAYEIACGEPPYSGSSGMSVFLRITRDGPPKLPEPRPKKWSQNFHNFLKTCLELNPNHRPSAEKLKEHPFIKLAPGESVMKKAFKHLRKLSHQKQSASQHSSTNSPSTTSKLRSSGNSPSSSGSGGSFKIGRKRKNKIDIQKVKTTDSNIPPEIDDVDIGDGTGTVIFNSTNDDSSDDDDDSNKYGTMIVRDDSDNEIGSGSIGSSNSLNFGGTTIVKQDSAESAMISAALEAVDLTSFGAPSDDQLMVDVLRNKKKSKMAAIFADDDD